VYVFPGLADAALGEGTGVKINKLSVKEIKAVRLSAPFSRRYPEYKCHFFLALWHDTCPEKRVVVSAAALELGWRLCSIPRLLSLCSFRSRGSSGDLKQITVSLYVLLGIYLRAEYFAAMLLL